SDRSAEVAKKLGGQIIVNVQADHLGITRRDYDDVLKIMLSDHKIKYATIAKKIDSEMQLYDANRVKVLLDNKDDAIWFSRYPLPYLQGIDDSLLNHFEFFYHIGVYFFRRPALLKYKGWPQGRYEKAESLEQLRILENHQRIKVYKTKSRVFSIDIPEDLRFLKKIVLK
ncbi:MAG: 3-deoxy-manno-octulosonate cytidylyltransferase, partial [candidate division Zixibacteria bacterium]|nr:3-deoxy-manno-octulosonate cytidylyltransferase [candidate division Zixibacteria bacterium]